MYVCREPADVRRARLSGLEPPRSEHLSFSASCPVDLPLLGYKTFRITTRRSHVIGPLIDPDHTERQVLSLRRDDMFLKIGRWKTLPLLLTFWGSGMGRSPKDSLICVIYDAAAEGPSEVPDPEMGCAKSMCGYSA